MKILLFTILTFNLLYGGKFSLIDDIIIFGKELLSVKKTTTVAIAGTSTGSSATTQREEITLQPTWYEQFQFAGYYMAQKNGYYKDKNLKLTILPYTEGMNSANEVVNNHAMYGIGDSSLVKEIIKGKNIFLLKAILQESPLVIFSLDEELENSINKRIILPKTVSKSIILKAILRTHGTQIEDFKVVYHSTKHIKDLITKNSDFIVGYRSNEEIILKEKNIKFKIFSYKQAGLKFYSDILFTSTKEFQENPDRVANFTKATMDGWRYAFNHIEETAKFIYQNHNEQGKSLSSLIAEGKILKKIAIEPSSSFGEISAEKLLKIATAYHFYFDDINNTKTISDYKEHIYLGAYVELKVKKYKYNLFLVFIFLLFLSIVSLIYWSFWLKKRVAEKNALLIDADKRVKIGTHIDYISHQLKSPLNSIYSITNNLKRDIDISNDNPTLMLWKSKLTEIENKSLIMTKTVNFFLKYFSQEHKKEYFSINETIENSINYIDIQNVTIEFENKEDFVYLGYEILLLQVFQTILENGIQALASKKDNRLITISIDEESDDSIVIVISDNGKGIPIKYLKKIFAPYFSTKKHANVKGLGLHIAKIIIEDKFHGTISAYNENGATFKIVLIPIKLGYS